MRFKQLVSLVALATLIACGGDSKEAEAKGDAAAGDGGNAEEIICCEYGGAKGTATRAKCEESKGKIHPRSECP